MTLKQVLNNFVTNPVKLFVLFVVVNIIPNIGLVFSEPFTLWGKVVLILFPLGLYLCVFCLSKNTSFIQVILIPLLVIHAFQIVVFYLFGEGVIAVDMFLNVATTNTTEASEVLKGVFWSLLFVIIVYIPTIIIAIIGCKRKIYLSNNFRKKASLSGIVIVILSYSLSFFAKNNNTGIFIFNNDVYPQNVFYNLNFAINKWMQSNQYLQTSEGFAFEAHKEKTAPQREIYVLVVGETSRAENWSMYGYDRNTTPLLENDSNIVFFRDVISQSNTTHKSVPIIMSAASAENYDIIYKQKSIIEAFKEVGFTTVFLSNQSANRTFTDYFAREADYLKYYREQKSNVNNFDEALLPQFSHYIDSIPGNLFIVLHTYGSHFNYKERYPADFGIYKPDDVTEVTYSSRNILINAYDNTILYTDHFLNSITKILEQSGACSTMFYVSDHGEDILDDDRHRFLHASPNPTIYQLRVPMFIWFSNIYKGEYPYNVENARSNILKPVSSNASFHTVLDIAHIKTKYKDIDLSLVSKEFKITERMYLNDHDDPIPYYKSGIKKEDQEVIKERNIHH